MNVEFIESSNGKTVSIIIDNELFSEVKVYGDKPKGRYIKLPNLAAPNFKHPCNLFHDNFHDRIADMYACIKNGWGDEICIPSERYSEYKVIRYMDRTVGEKHRAETLKKSSHYRFNIGIFREGDSAPLNILNEVIPRSFFYYFPLGLDTFKIRTFDSEDDCSNFIKKMCNGVKPLADLLIARRASKDTELIYEFMNYLYPHFDQITTMIFNYFTTSIFDQCPLFVGQWIDYSEEKWLEARLPSIVFPSSGTRLFMCDRRLNRYKNRYEVMESSLIFHRSELLESPTGWTSLSIFRLTDTEDINGDWFLLPEHCLTHPSYKELERKAIDRGTTLKVECGSISVDANYRHDDFMERVVFNPMPRDYCNPFTLTSVLEESLDSKNKPVLKTIE